MARFTTALAPIQVNSIRDYIKHNAGTICSRMDVENFADEMINYFMDNFPDVFPIEDEKKYFAYSLSEIAKFAIAAGDLRVDAYISMLSDIKQENMVALNDFGAFGDLLEILVRCAFYRKLSLVRWSALSVKAANQCDIVSRKYGKIEVGHNGKTWTQATVFDYMQGDFNAVVYGVFEDADRKEVFELCKAGKIDKAIEYVCSYCGYWESKYQFHSDMDNLSRGKGIALKGGNVQAVYNEGKYNFFVQALEEGKFKSLAELLKME